MGGHKAQAQSMSGHKNRTGIKFCDRCAHICSQHAHLLRLRGGPRAQGGEIDLRLQGGAARLRHHARGDRQRGGGWRLGAGPQDLQEEPGRHPFIEKSTEKMTKKIRIFLPKRVRFQIRFLASLDRRPFAQNIHNAVFFNVFSHFCPVRALDRPLDSPFQRRPIRTALGRIGGCPPSAGPQRSSRRCQPPWRGPRRQESDESPGPGQDILLPVGGTL